MLVTRIIAAGMFVVGWLPIFAQEIQKEPEFEAVSVKLSDGSPHGPPNSDGGPGTRYPELYGTNSTIRWLVGSDGFRQASLRAVLDRRQAVRGGREGSARDNERAVSKNAAEHARGAFRSCRAS